MQNALYIQRLNHAIKDKQILCDISFEVAEGTICGLLGHNGAGKSTLIKHILGLIPSSDCVFFQDISLSDKTRKQLLTKVGSLIENAALFPHLTAYENMEIVRRIYETPKSAIEDTLNMCGLKEKNLPVQKFSMGMKQRLGLALAMLHKPKVLILDEPTNGLDPVGIIEFRSLILHINKEYGTSILISSHILTEIEKMANHVVILSKGKKVYDGFMQERKKLILNVNVFEISDIESAKNILLDSFRCTTNVEKISFCVELNNESEAFYIYEKLVKEGVRFSESYFEKDSLEQIYMASLLQ